MYIDIQVLLVVLTKFLLIKTNEYDDSLNLQDHTDLYTNKWVVHIDGGPEVAKDIAEKYNFIFHGPLGSLPDLYHLEHNEVHIRSRRSADSHHSLLASHPKVNWIEQQKILSRKKRGYSSDPFFSKQWYLHNSGQTKDRCSKYKNFEKLDINVFAAWNKNITGQGVVVSILDDGLEQTHPDLKRNFDPEASYDFNGNDNNPGPRYSSDNINKHGTRCAGEVAAEFNNGICGTGVAYNAKVGGIRMLDGEVTDAVEAGSLSWKPQHIDIYSSSWGPDDDGRTVDGPGLLAKKAFSNGIKYGRKGRGSIFVWATGNGGRYNDYCSCDGYINSPYTISIGAVDNCGLKPWYAEACPGTFAVTYSSGEASGILDKQITTTDLHQGCTSSHTGTSAAAPLAAGIFALVLEANPKLTWRDLQHLVAKTSKMVSPSDAGWQKNGAGHYVNSKFGFGALDAGDLVALATDKDWKTARPQHECSSDVNTVNMKLKPNTENNKSPYILQSEITFDGCADDKTRCITKLEHVHLVIDIENTVQRGQLEIFLESPSGTVSDILRKRIRDTSRSGFQNWAVLSVFHWDEQPKGVWKLNITDRLNSAVKLKSWYLKMYGTCDTKKDKTFSNISLDDADICDKICKRDCPQALSEKCFECSHYCDCTTGKCVPSCDEQLVTDDQLRHCKRTIDYLDYNYVPNSGTHGKSTKTKPVMGIALSAKFAIICIALIAVSALIAGTAYLAAKMPNDKNLSSGYHSVSRYPCAEVIVEGIDEFGDDESNEDEATEVKS